MPIIVTQESSNHQNYVVPSGTHVARCYMMIELGTVTEPYMGEMKTAKKVRIQWELPLEKKEFKPGEGEKPFVIGQDFTLSLHEKSTLRRLLESWRGKSFSDEEIKAFDLTKLLGVPCLISVLNENKNGKTYAKISGVSPLAKGMNCPPQINPTMELAYDKFDFQKYNTLPNFVKEKMSKTPEYASISNNMSANEHYYQQQAQASAEQSGEQIDDLPF